VCTYLLRFLRSLGHISGRNENSTYYLSVCGVVTDPTAQQCREQIDPATSICQKQHGAGGKYFDIGNSDAQKLPAFMYTDIGRTAVTYNVTGAKQWSVQQDKTRCTAQPEACLL